MVQAQGDHGIEHQSREVYDFKNGYNSREKCTAIDANGPILVLGTLSQNKGFVCPLTKDYSEAQLSFEPSITDWQTKFRGGAKIEEIKYLARLDYFCLLIEKQLIILKQHDLMPVQTYKTKNKITNFCLNDEVYRSVANAANKSVSQIDQICICSNNTLFFLEAEFVTGIYKFTEDNRPAVRKGYPIGCTPEQLIWDGDKIYIASKREKAGGLLNLRDKAGLPLKGAILGRAGESDGGAYTVLDYHTGDILAILGIPQGQAPMMSVLNDKVLVVTAHGNRANFLSVDPNGSKQAVLSRSPYFNLDRGAQPNAQQQTPPVLVSINLVAEYVIAVFEYNVVIYKQSGEFLQDIPSMKLNNPNVNDVNNKFKYLKASINPHENEIILLAGNTKDSKNVEHTRVYVLREKDVQEQINFLLGMGLIDEAHSVFLTKQTKNTTNFNKKNKEFCLNAGWQMLNTGKPENILRFFRQTDVDPRELIMLFKDLMEILRGAMHDHARPISTKHKYLEEFYKAQSMQRPDFESQDCFIKAKEAIKQLFHHLNLKYLAELKRDEDKYAEFMYSDMYTLNENSIKQEERKLLRDIVPLVQTALIHMYIQDDEKGRDKIYEFFNQFSNGQHQSNHLYLLQDEMDALLKHPQFKNKDITKEAMALLYEHKGNYHSALDIWDNIKTQVSRKRIIQILKKSGGSKEWIKNYGTQVFLEDPEIGLKLFAVEAQENNGENGFGGEFVENFDSISMTTDEIIEFLEGIEDQLKNNIAKGGRERRGGVHHGAGGQEDSAAGSPSLKQKYLEQITKDSRTEGKYFTQLGRLLIQKCVEMRNEDYGLADKAKLKGLRDELYYFLENKEQYNASDLSTEVQKHTWLDQETILLLVKEKKFDEAIERYLEKEEFTKAEEFCSSHSQQDGLLTKLLENYFKKYNEAIKGTEIDDSSKATTYRERAIRLMQTNSSTGLLDPQVVLNKIPGDWALQCEDYDLIDFLSSLFDSQMTKEENAMIAANLSSLESFNAEIEKRELESAYYVIRDETECPWCNKTLGFKKIRIFPHGMAFHMRCAKPNQCPITKQRFDIDPIAQYD